MHRKMEMKTKPRCRNTQRKCSQIIKVSPKIERSESLKKVSNILRKKESLRSAEEIAVLASMTDEVKEVKFRLCRKQRTIERSKEIEDDNLVLRSKCKKLANALQRAKHLVVYTGAGISTAADIPDYRGPNGIWTMLQQGKKIGKHDLTRADPTMTHMALWQLYRKRYLKFVVSQNCDGLHLRSGLPRRALSEVHGNMYVEMCRECKPNVPYWRLFDTTERTARFSHKTGRLCHKCGAPLVDSIVHFGERGIAQWPLNWSGALHHAAKADVILCLGSSLKVLKKYPWLWAMDKPIKKRPAIFIVNLQWTPKDDVAELKINGKCDAVMKLVMEFLGLETPKYERHADPIFAHNTLLSPRELHTTTQPMLARTHKEHLVKDLVKKEKLDPNEMKNLIRNQELEDEDDDCPLNLLKIKMVKYDDILPEDLSFKSRLSDKIGHTPLNNSLDCEKVINTTVDSVKQEIEKETYSHLSSTERISYTNIDSKIDGTRVKMKTADFSCTVNVEEKSSVLMKSELANSFKNCSNLKINATINNKTHIKSESKLFDSDPNVNSVDGISMEILGEEFERVHVEMKTNDNEIHQVSILLVNKSKSSPKSCDKFQQTDPERLQMLDEIILPKLNIPPELNLIDMGQHLPNNLCPKPIHTVTNHEINFNNTRVKNDASVKIDSNFLSTQINQNGISISSLDVYKQINYSSEKKIINNTEKLLNPLRNFRRIKDIKTVIFNPKNPTSDSVTCDKETDVKLNGFCNISHEIKEKFKESVESSVNIDGPLDFSSTPAIAPQSPCIKIPKFVPEKKINQCILKIPKPPLYNPKHVPGHDKTNGDLALDLRVQSPSNNFKHNVNGRLKKPAIFDGCSNSNKNNDSLSKAEVKDEVSYENFKQQCELLARVIIQNTIVVNHTELQHAYPGIHSIINPVPFNVQYDFKSVFNALKFIHLGQKLMSKRKGGDLKENRKKVNDIKNTRQLIKKRRQYNRPRFSTKRKDPQCQFCYDSYKSHVCNFYFPHNSDERFEKYLNNKLVMCDCCGETETSSDSDDDDLSLMERKKRAEAKRLEESTESECNNSNLENISVLNSKYTVDLKTSVHISVKDSNDSSESKGDTVQPGWFGKGFRKNRRRKR